MTAPATPIPAEVEKLANDLLAIANASVRADGSDIPLGETCRKAALVLADRASQEERIREDERDRLYAEAEMQHAAALLRQDAIAGDVHAGAALWLKECGKGAMFPRDRARLRGGAS